MKEIIAHLNKAFESRIRLGIMSILLVTDSADFNYLKQALQQTDGNLASHLNALEKLKYIKVKKTFIGKKPNTSFAATTEGQKAFKAHLNGLEAILKNLPPNNLKNE